MLLVGNFLSGSTGTRGVCEDLAVVLKSAGWSVLTASNRSNRVARLLDFLLTVWRQRHNYSVAQVDVYSGRAFVWAELVCRALRMAKKPYVLKLHGGNLPTFAQSSGLAGRAKAEREFRLERLVSETLEAYKATGWKDARVGIPL